MEVMKCCFLFGFVFFVWFCVFCWVLCFLCFCCFLLCFFAPSAGVISKSCRSRSSELSPISPLARVTPRRDRGAEMMRAAAPQVVGAPQMPWEAESGTCPKPWLQQQEPHAVPTRQQRLGDSCSAAQSQTRGCPCTCCWLQMLMRHAKPPSARRERDSPVQQRERPRDCPCPQPDRLSAAPGCAG